MIKNKKILFTMMVIGLMGCSHQTTIKDMDKVSHSGQDLSNDKIAQAIIKAGSNRQWVCRKTAKGMVRCEQCQAKHTAVVDIVYDLQTFGIHHVKTVGMNEKHGKVHSRYNAWVERLKGEIIKEIALSDTCQTSCKK